MFRLHRSQTQLNSAVDLAAEEWPTSFEREAGHCLPFSLPSSVLETGMAEPVTLKTERLVLRLPEAADATQITQRIGERDVVWNLGRAPYPYQLSDAEEWIEKVPQSWKADSAYVFMLTTKTDGVIGCVGLDQKPENIWEIDYWLGKAWWGQGFVTEAASAVMHWAETERGLTAFASGHFTDNPASGRVLTKLGFEPVGETELFGRARGKTCPAIRYTHGADPDLALRLAAH